MDKTSIIPLLEKITQNEITLNLNHTQCRSLAFGMISVLDDIDDMPSQHRHQIKALITMITKSGAPHHARSFFAKLALDLLEQNNEKKLIEDNPMSPDNF